MPAPVSVPLPPKTRYLSLALADDVRACLAAFEPSFLDLLTRTPTPSSGLDGYRWPWEYPPASVRTSKVSEDLTGCSTRDLYAHERAVEPRHCTVIYQPCKAHHRQARKDMDHVVTLATLRVGLNSSAYIKRANAVPPAPGKGQDERTYVSKVWPRDQVDSWVGFCSELALYKSACYLRPLQGVAVPRLLGVFNTDSGTAMNMETPHPVFWFEASAAMPDVLKAKVISAYSDLHARGILHGDVALRHILVGGDARITIIDFQESRALVGDDALGLGSATETDLAIEMRRVRYVLDFESARAYEKSKTRREAERRRRNKDTLRILERRRRAGLPVDDLRLTEPHADDASSPPIHPEELREWQRSCNFTSRRVIMPETSEEQLCAAVSEFVGIVKELREGDASWSLSSESDAFIASASHSPSNSERPLPSPSVIKHTVVENSTSSETTVCPVAGSVSAPSKHPDQPKSDATASVTAKSIESLPAAAPPTATKRAREPAEDADADLDISPSKRMRQAECKDVVQSTVRPGRATGPHNGHSVVA